VIVELPPGIVGFYALICNGNSLEAGGGFSGAGVLRDYSIVGNYLP
jgi:hypothetical protein